MRTGRYHPHRQHDTYTHHSPTHQHTQLVLCYVVCAGWLLLSQHPGVLSYEQSLRYLKQWAAYQVGSIVQDNPTCQKVESGHPQNRFNAAASSAPLLCSPPCSWHQRAKRRFI